MPSEDLPLSLREELRENLARLRRDLELLDKPESEGAFAEDYSFQAYEASELEILMETDKQQVELVRAFYKSLRVLSEGHPGLVSADPQALERAYRITLEGAIELGELVLKKL